MKEFWIIKEPAPIDMFNTANDGIPECLLMSDSVEVSNGKMYYVNKEAVGTLVEITPNPDIFLAWEEDSEMTTGYNVWVKEDASVTTYKDGSVYKRKPLPTYAVIVEEGSFPSFIPKERVSKTESGWAYESNWGLLEAIPGKCLWTCYNYPEVLKGAKPDIGVLTLNTKSAEQYYFLVCMDDFCKMRPTPLSAIVDMLDS